jgi:hypothetical protein
MYEVRMADDGLEFIPDAVGYTQEGPLTTFFAVDHGRGPRFDAWSTKLLSVRTDRIVSIRRLAMDDRGLESGGTCSAGDASTDRTAA